MKQGSIKSFSHISGRGANITNEFCERRLTRRIHHSPDPLHSGGMVVAMQEQVQ